MAKYLEQLRSILKEQPVVGKIGFGEIFDNNLPEGVTQDTLKTLKEYRNDFGQALSERLIEFHQTELKGNGNVQVKVSTSDANFHTSIIGGSAGERIVRSRMTLDNSVLKQNIDLKYSLFNFDLDSKEFINEDKLAEFPNAKPTSMEAIIKHSGVEDDKDEIMSGLQCVFTDLVESTNNVDVIIDS